MWRMRLRINIMSQFPRWLAALALCGIAVFLLKLWSTSGHAQGPDWPPVAPRDAVVAAHSGDRVKHPTEAPPDAVATSGVPENGAARVLASTAVASFLTLAGHLEAQYRQMERQPAWSGDATKMPSTAPAEAVAKSVHFNPAAKSLSRESRAVLQGVVDEFDTQEKSLMAAERKDTLGALIRAAAAGQIESREVPPAMMTMDQADYARVMEKARVASQQMLEVLAVRLGREGVDWSYASTSSSEPDGVSRMNIVWFTRAGEPEVFRQRDEQVALTKRRHEAYLQFFRDLP